MSAAGAVLRLAWREALRAKGRSLLVVAMIGLPVLGVTASDVVGRTYQLTQEQQAERAMGTAQALVRDTGSVVRSQDALGQSYDADGSGSRTGPGVPLTTVLPGAVTLPDRSRSAQVAVPGRTVQSQVRSLSYADPLAAGVYRDLTGHPPHGGGEVTLTRALATRLGVGLGDPVSVDGRAGTVVGLVQSGSSYRELTALVDPALDLGAASEQTLVALPGLTWRQVQAANAGGYLVQPRTRLAGSPPPLPGGGLGASGVATLTLVVGMALLEVVLLAGPAFAVGAKRQERALALLQATGASRRDVRRVVLGGGLVLGAVGGVVGALAGTGLAAAALPTLRGLRGEVPGPFDVRLLEVLAIAVVGVGTAVLAALLPARGAVRQDPVQALTGRRGTVRSSAVVPVLGVLAAGAGLLLALQGARSRSVNTILAGSALAELGLVATTPYLVGLVGRLSPLLPVGPRLALRDAARHRGRTAPAVSAVLAAVAGAVAVATYLASQQRFAEQRYEPSALPGTAVVSLSGPAAASAGRVQEVVAAALPGADVLLVRSPGDDGVFVNVTCPAPCGSTGSSGHGHSQLGDVVVGDAATLRAVTGVSDPRLTAVLERGGMVAEEPAYVGPGGAATLSVQVGEQAPPRTVTVPAAVLPAGHLSVNVLSRQAAAALHVPVLAAGLVVTLPDGRAISPAQEDALRSRLGRVSADPPALYVERGPSSRSSVLLLVLLAGSGVIVLGASGTATGLAAAEGRADLSTLAAVGATPRLRRSLAAFQSAVTAGLGTALGVVAGLVPAVALLRSLNATSGAGPGSDVMYHPVVVPWLALGVTGLVVPALAALAAALLTRSRLPLVRRVA